MNYTDEKKCCFKGWTHDEIVAGNVAEVEWKSTPETLETTLRATRCNYPIARNVALWPHLNVALLFQAYGESIEIGARWRHFIQDRLLAWEERAPFVAFIGKG